jgi:hypothetical protein
MSTAFGERLARAATTPGVVCSASSTRVTHEVQCMFLMGTRIAAVPAA